MTFSKKTKPEDAEGMRGNGLDRNAGARFAFGKNWKQFLEVIDEDRITSAEQSLLEMLDMKSLEGKRFLDIGCGSGLFSLAAARLGAKVCSFDYDVESVECTMTLRERFFYGGTDWTVEQGSVLDSEYMRSLGTFDVVYSWGVLHHTGSMWVAFERAIGAVADHGTLFIAIYNDQGWKSRLWWMIKMLYNRLPRVARPVYAYAVGTLAYAANIARYTLRLRPMDAIRPMLAHRRRRGMSLKRDLVDWIGGFPYEFVSYEVLRDYFASRGLQLLRGRRATSLGCHEMVFTMGVDEVRKVD